MNNFTNRVNSSNRMANVKPWEEISWTSLNEGFSSHETWLTLD